MLFSLLFKKKRDTTTTTTTTSSFMRSRAITSKPVGLKSITAAGMDSPRAPNCVRRSLVASPSPSPSSRELKVLKVEVGDEEEDERTACWATYGRRSQCRRFPPPIPLLARTGNLSCHMPWVLKRTYKEDGSLVLKEVRVKHHEYFRACREDGRLTLQLVELDADSSLFTSAPECEEEAEQEEEIDRVRDPDEEHQSSASQQSLISSPSVSSYPSEREDCSEENIDAESVIETPRVQPRFDMPSMMLLSSSIPEPVHA